MEYLPDEIIGEILSRISDAHDVVIASTTCKKWRRAMECLKSLTFDASGCFRDLFHDSEIHSVETAIAQIIRQTKSLESLTIRNDADYNGVNVEFSAVSMRSWLMHTKDTLRELLLHTEVHPKHNIFEKCQWNKLEYLELGHFSFSGVELSDTILFPCLKKLLLLDVKLSALQLNNFIDLCPKIEYLRLISMDVGPRATLEWFIPTLKNIEVIAVSLERFVLKADGLETLCFEWCKFQLVKLVGNGALKVLNIQYSRISYFDVVDNIKNLENVDVYVSTVKGTMLYTRISESSNLTRFRLWPATYDDCYGFTNLETISVSFPRLTHLSLKYTERVDLCLRESFLLQNVAALELGFPSSCYFLSDRIEGFIERCPKLKKMDVHMFNCEQDNKVNWVSLERFSSSIVQLGRKYLHLEFEFKYHKAGF